MKENQIGHSSRDHAILSASGSKRWLNCTPSAQLEDQFGEKSTSVFAEEGTLAHEISEILIRKQIPVFNIGEEKTDFDAQLSALQENELYNPDMLGHAQFYADYCYNLYSEALSSGEPVACEVEAKLDFSKYVPFGFGTGDYLQLSRRFLDVVDLKYGRGVKVEAEENSQLMIYGLGALLKYDMIYEIDTVRLHIVQPRLDSVSVYEIPASKLRDWAENYLRPRAEMAIYGKGELASGDWCRFCSVKNRCRKLYEKQMEIAKFDFLEPELLSDEEVAEVLHRAPVLVEWANSVAEYAQRKAVDDGKTWPGFKLVEGVSRRKWADEKTAAEEIVKRIPGVSEEDIYVSKLFSITEAEKLIGKKKFAETLKDLVIKPEGKPCLVPEDDKRPAIGIAQAKIDFSNQ